MNDANQTDALINDLAAKWVDVVPLRRNKDTEPTLRMMLRDFLEQLARKDKKK